MSGVHLGGQTSLVQSEQVVSDVPVQATPTLPSFSGPGHASGSISKSLFLF